MISLRTIGLEAQVRRSPEDLQLVEQLWRSLLDDGCADDARRWLVRLVDACEVDEPYRALHLMVMHATATGDPTRLAHLRARLGLDFAFETVTPHEALERIQQGAAPLADGLALMRPELEGLPVRWVDGDLALPHLDLCDEAPLVVAGSLDVAGSLLDASYPLSMLVILGDLTAGQAITRGELHVGGNATIRGLWYLNSGNDYRVRVLGAVGAEVFVEDGMHVLVGGALEGGHLVSRHNSVQSRAGVLPHQEIDRALDRFAACSFADGDAEPTVEALVYAASIELPLLRPGE